MSDKTRFVCFASGIARFAGCLIAFRNKPEEAAKYQVL